MKTKNCGVYAALAAVLLVSAVLVTNCVDPVGILTGTQETWQSSLPPPPPGKAYFRIILPDAGRTILPDAPGAIASYKVEIVGKGSEGTFGAVADANDGTIDFDSNQEIFTVNVGHYTVTVSGYTTNNATGTPVAMGQDIGPVESDNVTYLGVPVTASGGSASVTLAKIVDGATTPGTFSYNFTLPSGLTSASLQIIPYAGTTAFATRNLIAAAGDNTGTIASVPSAYYRVNVTMAKPKHETVTYSQILHIYGGQISRWGRVQVGETPPAPAALLIYKNKWDVTLDANTGTEGSGGTLWDNGGAGWDNGGYVASAPSGTHVPTKASHIVNGWYTAAGSGGVAGGTEYVFGNMGPKIYKDITLYANWEEVSEGALTITLTAYVHETGPTFSFSVSDYGFTHAEAIAPAGLTINVTASNTGFTSAVGWFKGEDLIVSGYTLTTAAINTFNSANEDEHPEKVINFTVGNKAHEFTFRGLVGTEPYDGTFTINIGAP